MAMDVKTYIYGWLGKNKLPLPEYKFTDSTMKNGQLQFNCELRGGNFPYVWYGEGWSKKAAMTSAAIKFGKFLWTTGKVKENEIRPYLRNLETVAVGEEAVGNIDNEQPRPNSEGEVQQNDGQNRTANKRRIEAINDRPNKVRAEQADMVALDDPSDNGGWTTSNAKQRLNQFLQTSRISADFTFRQAGPEHSRAYIAQIRFFVPRLGREIFQRAQGSTKKDAKASCAMMVIRQLYRQGMIEAFTDRSRKEEGTMECEIDMEPVARPAICTQNRPAPAIRGRRSLRPRPAHFTHLAPRSGSGRVPGIVADRRSTTFRHIDEPVEDVGVIAERDNESVDPGIALENCGNAEELIDPGIALENCGNADKSIDPGVAMGNCGNVDKLVDPGIAVGSCDQSTSIQSNRYDTLAFSIVPPEPSLPSTINDRPIYELFSGPIVDP